MGQLVELIESARQILDYYDRYGFLRWEEMSEEEFDSPPTRVMVGLSDYVSCLMDLRHVLSPAGSGPFAELRSLHDRLQSILAGEVGCEQLVAGMTSVIENNLRRDVAEAAYGDEFDYELACAARELVEKYREFLEERCGGVAAAPAVEAELEQLDSDLRAAQKLVTRQLGADARPFPAKNSYTPAGYWWYIEGDPAA